MPGSQHGAKRKGKKKYSGSPKQRLARRKAQLTVLKKVGRPDLAAAAWRAPLLYYELAVRKRGEGGGGVQTAPPILKAHICVAGSEEGSGL